MFVGGGILVSPSGELSVSRYAVSNTLGFLVWSKWKNMGKRMMVRSGGVQVEK